MLEEADDDTQTATFRIYGRTSLTATVTPTGDVRFTPTRPHLAPRTGAAPSVPRTRAARARWGGDRPLDARGWQLGGGGRDRCAGGAEAAVKPAPFEYVAVRSVEEALAALDEDSRVLAGGQSLCRC